MYETSDCAINSKQNLSMDSFSRVSIFIKLTIKSDLYLDYRGSEESDLTSVRLNLYFVFNVKLILNLTR